jgi:hypothetical protein
MYCSTGQQIIIIIIIIIMRKKETPSVTINDVNYIHENSFLQHVSAEMGHRFVIHVFAKKYYCTT